MKVFRILSTTICVEVSGRHNLDNQIIRIDATAHEMRNTHRR
jgi:hypothetical protein